MTSSSAPIDAITVEVVNQSLAGIVREMQDSLFCTGYSTIIRESRDASCAIVDPTGRVMAQHIVLPLHFGAFPACTEALLRNYDPSEMADGDAFIVNHPYQGGSPHAPDMAVFAPMFIDGDLFGFTCSMAHKPDIGGLVPGSSSGMSREIFHDGIMIPPARLYRQGELIKEVEIILRANSRTPDLIMGDIRGQVGSTWLGVDRVKQVCAKYGASTISEAAERLFDMTEGRVRAAISNWPDGVYRGEAMLHNDGIEGGTPVYVRVTVTIEGDRAHFDFREADNQCTGPFNIRPPLVQAVCSYVLKSLIDPDLPSNHGLSRVIEADFRQGSILNPNLPAPVNTYMPVAHTTAEALFDALGHAVPGAHAGECSGSIGGTLSHSDHREGYPAVQYELPGGAIGARGDMDGVSASKSHVANGTITSIEIVESEFPVRIERFELTPDTGGAGRFRGGLAYVREYRMLGHSRLSTRGGRDLTPAEGRAGGLPGNLPKRVINPDTSREYEIQASDGNVDLNPGDVLRYQQPGGGGYGDPKTRPIETVLNDVREGYVTPTAARQVYGVEVKRAGYTWLVDEAKTAKLRS
jgi:N-methylhydantoinase B